MKKLFSVILILLLLCSCGDGGEVDGVSRVNEDLTPLKGGEIRLFCDFPDTLNPIATSYKSVSEVMYLVYDGLFRTENDFSAVPVLSSGYTASANNTQYVVRLKKGVKFHDGTEFDGNDVVSTVDRIKSSNSKYNSNLSNVASYAVQEDGSIVFNLKAPQSNFVNLLDFPIMPSELGNNDYAVPNPGFVPVGTGRFKPDSLTSETLLLVKNNDYHGKKPYVDNIKITYVKDKNIAKYSFEAMEFDVITTDLYSWGDTSMSGDFTSVEYESNRLTYLGLNCLNAALADKGVRRAFSTAVDKSSLVSEIMFTHAAVVSTPVNPNAFFANNEYVHAAYEKGKAKEELKSVGWLDLDGDGVLDKYFGEQQLSLSFALVVNADNPSALSLAQLLAQQMGENGIHLNIVPLDYISYISAIINGEYDMYIGRMDIANDCDISFMLESGGSQNYFRYSSAAMDGVLQNIRKADGTHNVKSAYSAFDAMFKDEQPFIPLYFETDAVFSSVRIKGDVGMSRTGVYTGLDDAFVKYREN